jgi:hypothetical protein
MDNNIQEVYKLLEEIQQNIKKLQEYIDDSYNRELIGKDY